MPRATPVNARRSQCPPVFASRCSKARDHPLPPPPKSDAESAAGNRETLAVPACIRVALLNGPRQGEDNLFGFIQAGPPAVLRAHLLGALRTGLQQIRPVVPRGRMHAIQVPPSLRVLPDLSALHGYWSYRQAWRNP